MWPGPALPSGQIGQGLTVLGKCAYFDKAKPLNSCLCVYSIGIFFFLFCSVKNLFAWNNTTDCLDGMLLLPFSSQGVVTPGIICEQTPIHHGLGTADL